MTDLLTAGEAARLLGVKPDTINKYVARSLLVPARKVHARLWLYHRADIEALRGRRPGRPETTGAGKRRKDRRASPGQEGQP